MKEQSNQSTKTERFHTQHHGAHSGCHSGISDYNDGGQLSHYGGDKTEEDFNGSVAYGNESEAEEETEQTEVHGKYHSGL